MHQGFTESEGSIRDARICVCERDAPEREELERFVHDAFAARHGAHVHSFMPTLLAMRNESGVLASVAGYRCADHEPLFLERYLSAPIECTLTSAAGQRVERHQIVEVGNLAGSNCRAAMRLILELPRLLLERGQLWIVFTATDTVRALLEASGAPMLQLATAEARCVAGTNDDWGSYYETDPRVMAGFLPHGRLLRRHRVHRHAR